MGWSIVSWLPALLAGAMTALYIARRVTFAGSKKPAILFTRIPLAEMGDVHTPHLGYYYRSFGGQRVNEVTSEEERALAQPWHVPDWSERSSAIPQGAEHPLAVARDGLHSHTRYLDNGDTRFIGRLLQAADWLVVHQGPSGEFSYSFPWKTQAAGWVSGLGQGAAITTLTRAYQETDERQYVEAALRAYDFMLTPVEEGGTQGSFSNGDPIVEEYPGLPDEHPQVLNGAISAYFGIHDLARVTGDVSIQHSLDELLASLKRNLYRYRAEPLSRYDTREKSRATLSYHRMHVTQLRALALIARDAHFDEAASDFARQVEGVVGRARVVLQCTHLRSADRTFWRVVILGALVTTLWAWWGLIAATGMIPASGLATGAYAFGAALSLAGLGATVGRTTLCRRLPVCRLTPVRVLFVGSLLGIAGSVVPLAALHGGTS